MKETIATANPELTRARAERFAKSLLHVVEDGLEHCLEIYDTSPKLRNFVNINGNIARKRKITAHYSDKKSKCVYLSVTV